MYNVHKSKPREKNVMKNIKKSKTEYVVQYGVNFSHMSEYECFKLYRDAVKFFNSLDRTTFPSAFLYKQEYVVPENEIHCFACDVVEYKMHYTEIKNSDFILETMANGKKF